MVIGIDCRLAGIENAGIGRYIEELVRGAIRDETITWVLFFQKKNQLSWVQPSARVRIVIAPIRHYSVQEQFLMPFIFAREHLDLLHVPHFNVPLLYQGPYVVTIHDLLWHDQRGASMTTLSPLVYRMKYVAYRFVSKRAITGARAIFVPAHTIKQTVLSHIPHIDSKKIMVTYEGVDAAWFQQDQETKSSQRKALFYTGSLYPHKNVMLIVRALRDLPDFHLYISSSRNVFVQTFLSDVQAMGMADRVTHVGCLSDTELRVWYHKSFALVQPSLSEGFGLTGVEAMAAGVPIMASDIPIFREVYQDSFTSFDPLYPESFVQAVHELEKKSHAHVIAKGKELAKKYSWEKMSQETLNVYKKI